MNNNELVKLCINLWIISNVKAYVFIFLSAEIILNVEPKAEVLYNNYLIYNVIQF